MKSPLSIFSLLTSITLVLFAGQSYADNAEKSATQTLAKLTEQTDDIPLLELYKVQLERLREHTGVRSDLVEGKHPAGRFSIVKRPFRLCAIRASKVNTTPVTYATKIR